MHSYPHLNQLHTPSKLDFTQNQIKFTRKPFEPERIALSTGFYPNSQNHFKLNLPNQARPALTVREITVLVHTSRNLQRDQTLPSLNHKKKDC